jgi:hypothetical protein
MTLELDVFKAWTPSMGTAPPSKHNRLDIGQWLGKSGKYPAMGGWVSNLPYLSWHRCVN